MKKDGHFSEKAFSPDELRLLRAPPPSDFPPLGAGDWCTLNSGSLRMLVIRGDDDCVTVRLPNGDQHLYPRACVRRSG
jgi:hypothetical protein